MGKRHEELYRTTVSSFMSGVQTNEYAEGSVPYIAEGIGQELAQCHGLRLISEDFSEEMFSVIAPALQEA